MIANRTVRYLLSASCLAMLLPACTLGHVESTSTNPWMAKRVIAQQSASKSNDTKEAVANRRAKDLIAVMTLPQKFQQLTGAHPEIVPELPHCYGARHVRGIAELNIPTLRITNGPVGLGQNDCVAAEIKDKVLLNAAGENSIAAAYTDPSSAQATALPSAMGVAASFDPDVANLFGEVIATEMHNLALHVFEAPGINMTRLPILGRNFEYFGEDPYLTGVMATAEIEAVQDQGLIAMAKHYAANEQETNRLTIQENVDRQSLHELYLLPFEMAVKDGNVASLMCAYNYVNGQSSCESRELLTDVLRDQWGFTGYVQSDFFAMKSTVETLANGLDHEMPTPRFWTPEKLTEALDKGALTVSQIDTALERRYTQMFKAGIFDRPIVQTPIDFKAGGIKAREIGARSAVLLQNNGALPLAFDSQSVVMIGKASQVYAQQAVAGGSVIGEPMGSGGGSSDVVPNYTVSPIDGLRAALSEHGDGQAKVKLILVDDVNQSATIDGKEVSFQTALDAAASADAVIMMAGTISEEGADRATFTDTSGKRLALDAAKGSELDWYAHRSNRLSTIDGRNITKNSGTTSMIAALLGTQSKTARSMAEKSVLVLKDNAGVAMPPEFVGSQGPSILEVWFPGQEDGNIVADLLIGKTNPSGKLPVTFPFSGKGYLDGLSASQFPGVIAEDGSQTVTYSEQLAIGYRWYDANKSGNCAEINGANPCVAFPFGHGLSYTSFSLGEPKFSFNDADGHWRVTTSVTNTGKRAGAEVVQTYISLPPSASELGLPQPPKRLVGFGRINLAPGASGDVSVTIDPSAANHPLGIWSVKQNKWVEPSGEFKVLVGRSSAPKDLKLAGTIRR